MIREPLKVLAKVLNVTPESIPREMVLEYLKHASEEALNELCRLCSARWPHPRQAEFLALPCDEALYGGAAGGGKTEALLMWLAEGIPNRQYAAVIFRRTRPQLARADGLIAKSRMLYGALQGAYHETTLCWRFPSGATIELGYLEHDRDVENYQGTAYTRIAFDELTQFTEFQYTYLFSRLGRTDIGIKPGMRAASNPGGLGHLWVKNRFVTKEAIETVRALDELEPTPPGTVFYSTPKRAFVPARIADNPSLNRSDYLARLAENLDPLTRARLKDGDWSVSEQGRIREAWFRHYFRRGEHYLFQVGGQWQASHRQACQCFVIVDCAATSEEEARKHRGKPPSYSAIGVFLVTKNGKLVLADMRRGLWDFPELAHRVVQAKLDYQPDWIGIEDEKTGLALIQLLRPQGYNIKALSPEGKDKLTRATAFLVRLEAGGFWIPDETVGAGWLEDLKAEFLLWTGHPDETADQIDVCAYACREWQRQGQGEVIRLDGGLFAGKISGGSPFGRRPRGTKND